MIEPTDEQWLAQVREGDRVAARDITKRHLPGILRYARRMLGRAHEAEDVAQEVFLRLWEHLDDVEARSTLRTWLYRVTHNLAIDRLRRRREVSMPDDRDWLLDAPSASQRIEQAEQAMHVERAVGSLPERQRAAISLVFQEGLRQRDAASILGVTPDALESLLARARRTLKETLLAYDNEGPT
jgi:RNA polymerase sigma-70 factor, ECF subfamily